MIEVVLEREKEGEKGENRKEGKGNKECSVLRYSRNIRESHKVCNWLLQTGVIYGNYIMTKLVSRSLPFFFNGCVENFV